VKAWRSLAESVLDCLRLMGLTAPARRLPRATQSGDKARQSFAKRVEMAGHGTARPEVVQARAFLSANPERVRVP
jgi:hypothetical protein